MVSMEVSFSQFVVVIGWDRFSGSITDQLLASSNYVVVLAKNDSELEVQYLLEGARELSI